MIGAQPSPGNFSGQYLPILIVTPIIDLEIRIDTKPSGIDIVVQVFFEV